MALDVLADRPEQVAPAGVRRARYLPIAEHGLIGDLRRQRQTRQQLGPASGITEPYAYHLVRWREQPPAPRFQQQVARRVPGTDGQHEHDRGRPGLPQREEEGADPLLPPTRFHELEGGADAKAARGDHGEQRPSGAERGEAQQLKLFPSHVEAPADDPQVARVLLNKVRLERTRQFGACWLGLELWERLELDRFFAAAVDAEPADVPWSRVAALLAINRLCAPGSELAIEQRWYPSTALDDLLGIAAAKVNDDRLYRALDRLLPHKAALQMHIKDRLGTLFQLDYDLFLYDITSTYFEGQAAKNAEARRGHSRDKSSDCLQVCIGLVVTREGYPVGYEVFAGNRNDATTVRQIVTTMEQRYGTGQRIWVMDRGMIHPANLKWLQERGCRDIVGTPKDQLKSFSEELTSGPWEAIREGLEVQRIPGVEGQDSYLLCRSAERAAKEQAMHQRFEQRIEQGLQRLRAGCQKRRYKVGVVERRVGRLLAKNSRAARLFAVQVVEREGGGSSITWSKKPTALDWATRSQGCYVLRTNVTDWTPASLWQTYVQLTEADILTEVVAPDQPTLPQEFARAVLSVRFNDSATEKIRELLQKNNAGTITTAEKADLEKYMRVGQFLDLLQAKARLSLKANGCA